MDSKAEPHLPKHGDGDARAPTTFVIGARALRPPAFLLSSNGHNHNATQASAELASIMNAASNPVSPGSLGLPPTYTRTHDFVPPTRPNSTPFPQPEVRADAARCSACLSDLETETCSDHEEPRDSMAPEQFASDGTAVDAVSQQTLSMGTNISALPPARSLSPILISTVATTPNLRFYSHSESPPHNLDDGGQGQIKAETMPSPRKQALGLQNLPLEIQELILDHVFHCRVSPMTKSWPDKRLTRLASFTRGWRTLIQKRLYCRIKLKATAATLSNVMTHFQQHPHLRSYVKHVELWFPVFELKQAPPVRCPASRMPVITLGDLSNALYTLPSTNCTLEEAFYVLGTTFPDLNVLTLEGGERKKAPQVRYFVHEAPSGSSRNLNAQQSQSKEHICSRPRRSLPQISSVRTLICKGQWNLVRCDDDFQKLMSALPNLRDWQASYSKPKSKSYLTMATILCQIPASLTLLNLCLEGDYRQEISFTPSFSKVVQKIHFCTSLAEATPALERLSYTGRVCHTFFDVVARLADPRTTRLKSVDLTVKNCCRHVNHWHESGSGATDLNFIRAFESLVLSAVRSLSRLKKLEYLRIRYVDLEFPVPPLNPFFLISNGRASGVWSDTIVAELNRVRPDICWVLLSDSIGERMLSMDGRLIIYAEFPKKRVVSLKLSNYAYLRAPLATM
ncbi:hypothetical protein SEPCBS119000_002725 [Sporothrix epigloea]|uniref:F-box domain-containing protein n=1 Tax=Sporothrix epigloea TaxID=1892477 RepID=A0ABP0DIZ8_9PEZI